MALCIVGIGSCEKIGGWNGLHQPTANIRWSGPLSNSPAEARDGVESGHGIGNTLQVRVKLNGRNGFRHAFVNRGSRMLNEPAKGLRLKACHNIVGSPIKRIEEADPRRVRRRVGVIRVEISKGRKRRGPPRTMEGVKVIIGIRASIRQYLSGWPASPGLRVERSEFEVG